MNEVEIVVKGTNRADSVFNDVDRASKGWGQRFKGAMSSIAKESGELVSDGVSRGVKDAGEQASKNPYLAAGIAAGIALGTPAIGGAITAAIGGGALAGGILLASRDPQVAGAWEEFGKSATDKLTGAANVFVEPLIRGSEKFGDTLDQLLPDIKNDFAIVAPVVDHIVDGISALATNAMPGVNSAIRTSVPILEDLAAEAGKFGSSISQALDSISRGGAGGKEALLDIIHQIEGLIVVTGTAIEYTERWYESEKALAHFATGDFSGAVDRMTAALTTTKDANVGVAESVRDAGKAVQDAIIPAGQAAELTSDQFKTLSDQINATAETADTLAGQMTDKLISTMLNLDTAALGFEEGLTRLDEAVDHNGTSLDVHTAKGQANERAILGIVRANQQVYDANLAAGMSAEDAAAAYDTNTARLEANMRQAGFTQSQIDGLIGKYRAVPDRVNTTIALEGLTRAINDLADLMAQINHVARTHYGSVIITEEYRTSSPYAPGGSVYKSQVPGAYAHGGIVGAQGGGPRSGGTVVGEHGWELLDLAPGTRVHSHEDSVRMMSEMGGNAASEVKVSFDFTGADEEFAKFVRKFVRINGGGNVQTAFGRN
jgi:hypothetical protein